MPNFFMDPARQENTFTAPRDISTEIHAVEQVVRPQIVATRGVIPSAPVVGTYVMTESRLTVQNGDYPCTDIQLALVGFSVDSGGVLGEVAVPNNITWNAAVEKVSPSKAVKASVGGKTAIVIEGGSGITLTNKVGFDLAANEVFKVQLGQLIATTADTYLASYNLPGLADYYRATALTSTQVGTAGTWSATSRGSNQNVASSPIIIGRPTLNYPSVIFLGDSIGASRDDLVGDAYGNHGFARGLQSASANGHAIPYANLCRSGERASVIANGNAIHRMQFLEYASHAFCNHGTNDAQQGRTFAQLKADLTLLWASIRARGVSPWHILLMPRTTSSDSWATVANQTVVAGFEIGGVRDQINTWITAQVGTLIDGIVDPNSVVEDQTSHGKWVATGATFYATTDGIHPTDAIMALVAPLVAAKARTFTINRDIVRV